MKIYLASNSPRRWELLQQLGLELEKLPADIDETPLPQEAPRDYVLRMAQEKNQMAQANLKKLSEKAPHFPVLTADTVVVLGDQILGKPQNPAQAAEMLRALSGTTHQVLTAVCLSLNAQQHSLVQSNDVSFKALTEAEIQAYIASGEPMDKAGAYGIQGKGGIFIRHLSGSFTGVMGLPIFETAELLAKVGIKF